MKASAKQVSATLQALADQAASNRDVQALYGTAKNNPASAATLTGQEGMDENYPISIAQPTVKSKWEELG